MNLDSIKTPSDLVNQNEELKTNFEKVVEGLSHCDYDETKKIILWLTTNMVEFHEERSQDDTMSPEDRNMWSRDHGRLECVINILRNTL